MYKTYDNNVARSLSICAICKMRHAMSKLRMRDFANFWPKSDFNHNPNAKLDPDPKPDSNPNPT